MARIDYSFVEFHSPVFIKMGAGGKNLGIKVHADANTKIYYDPAVVNAKIVIEYRNGSGDWFTTTADSFHTAQPLSAQKKEALKPAPAKAASKSGQAQSLQQQGE